MTTTGKRRSFQAITGISLAGMIALIAANGKAFFEAIGAMPLLLTKLSDALPLGAGSFMLVLTVSGFVWMFTLRWLHAANGSSPAQSKDFLAEAVTLLFSLGAMLALDLVSPSPVGATRAATIVQALMLGLLAGFSAPFVMKGVIASIRFVHDTVTDDGAPE